MLENYFKGLYERTMREAYALAHDEIVNALWQGGDVLDCGASTGVKFDVLQQRLDLDPGRYHGVEWSQELVDEAQSRGLDVVQADLNQPMAFDEGRFRCIYALSLVEHLLNPCRFMREAHRCLEPGGTLVILTPNISTFFTVALLLLGKMPSSGPHPDSDALIRNEVVFKVSSDSLQPDSEGDTPVHRHLVVFSYRVLKSYLQQLGFAEIRGYGFGLYPFPNFLQPPLERLDPYHCHQMVFVARK